MAYVITAIPAGADGRINVVQASLNLPCETTLMSLIHGDIEEETAIAPPIKNSPSSDQYRIYFIPMCIVVPGVSDPSIFGVICQSFGRTYWLRPSTSTVGSTLCFEKLSTPFPEISSGRPSPFLFRIELDVDTNYCTGKIYNLLRQSYVKSNGSGMDFAFVPASCPNCQFKFRWGTGTGPVMPTQPTGSTKIFYIMTNSGKAIVASAAEPYLAWADLDANATNQLFYFKAASWPAIGNAGTVYAYYVCSLGADNVICFDDNNTISVRPIGDAGDWEKLSVVMGPYTPEYFGRFKITGLSFGARLKAGLNGTVSLVSSGTMETPSDYFFTLPAY